MGNGVMWLHQKSSVNFTAALPKNVTSQRQGGRTCGTTGVGGLKLKHQQFLVLKIKRTSQVNDGKKFKSPPQKKWWKGRWFCQHLQGVWKGRKWNWHKEAHWGKPFGGDISSLQSVWEYLQVQTQSSASQTPTAQAVKSVLFEDFNFSFKFSQDKKTLRRNVLV